MKLNLTTKDGRPLELNTPQAKGWLRFGAVVMVAAFCLFGAKTLLGQALYQQRVISTQHKAEKQLATNINAASTLTSQYNTLFENSNPINVLGGKSDTSAQAVPPDIDNARLALDAMPTTYDYPALIASVTKMMNNNQIGAPSITGTDQTNTVSSAPSLNPQPVAINLTISGIGNYSTIQQFLKELELSIRPFDVTSLQLSGNEANMSFTAAVTTYFQPAKVLGITESKVQ